MHLRSDGVCSWTGGTLKRPGAVPEYLCSRNLEASLNSPRWVNMVFLTASCPLHGQTAHVAAKDFKNTASCE